MPPSDKSHDTLVEIRESLAVLPEILAELANQGAKLVANTEEIARLRSHITGEGLNEGADPWGQAEVEP